MRAGSMLEGMFLDIASPQELETLERLYEKRNYGSAEQFAVRRMREPWVEFINGKA